MKIRKKALTGVIAGGLVLSGAALSIASAQDAQIRQFNISAQPLSDALIQLAEETGLSIMFDPQMVGDIRSPT